MVVLCRSVGEDSIRNRRRTLKVVQLRGRRRWRWGASLVAEIFFNVMFVVVDKL